MFALLSFSLRQRALIIIFACILAIAGVHAFQTIAIDAFPDVTSVLVQVVTKAPGSRRPRWNVSSPFPSSCK